MKGTQVRGRAARLISGSVWYLKALPEKADLNAIV